MWGSPDSATGEIFDCGIQNLGKFCMWNPASWALESVIQLELSGILQTTGIRNPNSTEKESGLRLPGIRKPTCNTQHCSGRGGGGSTWITFSSPETLSVKNETSENRKAVITLASKIVHEWKGQLQFFSRLQVTENSRQYLLQIIYRKQSLGPHDTQDCRWRHFFIIQLQSNPP